MKVELQYFFTKIYSSFYSFVRRSNVCSGRETDGDKRRQRQTAILSHNFHFSRQYHAMLSSRPHIALLLLLGRRVLNWRPLWATSLTVTSSWDSNTHTVSNWFEHSHIYHFIMPTISDQPRDCFRLFTQVHPVQRDLLLTALSRVNKQQRELPLPLA